MDDALSCPVCGATHPPDARFCSACGAHLSWTVAERRTITVLFADLSGFTRLTEQLDAEQVHSLITAWLDPLCEAVLRWGGFVDKFIGDCVMALFGAPTAYENEPERAVRAALDMHAAFNEEAILGHAAAAGLRDYRPRLSIGVNTGGVVTGMFSSGGAWDYTAVGDTVNVAARLQGICEPGSVLVGGATYHQTRHLFEFGDELLLQVKGRQEPVLARPVLGMRARRGRVRGFDDRHTRLVGRRDELDRLRELWREAKAGSSRVCLLLGAAGIGKSRLVAELVAAERLEDDAVARGRSYPYASSTPWEPIAELLRDLHGVGSERSAPEAVEAIVDHAPRPWAIDARAALGAVLGSPASELESLSELSPEERSGRLAAAVSRALEEGMRGPTLLVLEDLHWADRTTLDFLKTLADAPLHGSVLLVPVSRRPLPSERSLVEVIERFPSFLELQPLVPRETAELVGTSLGEHALSEELLKMIHDRSGGNPLFIEEIVKVLAEEGRLTRKDGVWRIAGEERTFRIPDSIESLITTRIDALDPSTRRVLQYAAIVGRRFWPGVVEEALSRRGVEPEMEKLIEAALVHSRPDSAVAGETEYAFEHLLLQEVAYAGLLNSLRSEMHGAVARWLEENLPRATAESDDWIAYHLERSTEPALALPYLERAITSARSRGALLDAAVLVDRALAVAAEAAQEARFHGISEDIARATGDDGRRLEAIERLASLGEAANDPALVADATLRRARRSLDIGELEETRVLSGEALASFKKLNDPSAEADALTLLGRVDHLRGAYESALERYQGALVLERSAGDRRGEAEILRSLGLAEVDFGHFTRALDYFDQVLAIYEELASRPGRARALADRATALRWLGQYDDAENTARMAEDTARSCSSRSALIEAKLARAVSIGAAGRTEEARGLLREVLDEAPGLRRPSLEARAWLALSQLESGSAASEAVGRARQLASKSGLIDIEVFGLSRLAQLALESGDPEAADRASAQAVELLEQLGDIRGPDEVVYYTRSRALAALGRRREANEAGARARDIIRRTAACIEDEELRRSFLENVEPNPAIMETVR